LEITDNFGPWTPPVFPDSVTAGFASLTNDLDLRDTNDGPDDFDVFDGRRSFVEDAVGAREFSRDRH